MNKKLKKEAIDLVSACYSDGQVFQTGRSDLTPKRRVEYEEEIVELLDRVILAERERLVINARNIANIYQQMGDKKTQNLFEGYATTMEKADEDRQDDE